MGIRIAFFIFFSYVVSFKASEMHATGDWWKNEKGVNVMMAFETMINWRFLGPKGHFAFN